MLKLLNDAPGITEFQNGINPSRHWQKLDSDKHIGVIAIDRKEFLAIVQVNAGVNSVPFAHHHWIRTGGIKQKVIRRKYWATGAVGVPNRISRGQDLRPPIRQWTYPCSLIVQSPINDDGRNRGVNGIQVIDISLHLILERWRRLKFQ